MDGLPTSATQSIAGALASQQALKQQAARRAPGRRLAAQAAASAGVDPDALDAPVEQLDDSPAISAQLPGRSLPLRVAETELPHIDVRA